MTQPDDRRRGSIPAVRFGQFQLDVTRRQLLESGRPVRLGTRAIDILSLLVERAGELVSKEDLMARVWPRTVVEEINLRVHVAALRRALGDGQAGNRFIVNAAGRGYSFVAPLVAVKYRASPIASHHRAQPIAAQATHNLPTTLTRMVGRAVEVESLVRLVKSQRLLTIVGAGGVGKTTVALAVALEFLEAFHDGVHFVDLAAIPAEAALAGAFAAALGVSVSEALPARDLIDFLKDKRLLLLVDNCEHLIAGVARLIEALLKAAPGLRVLATSREPLSAEGEWQYRLAPLSVPAEEPRLNATEAREHSAVQLFVERAMTGEHTFELNDANVALVASICRTLDGLPLAIELAAAGMAVLGLKELAVRVHDQVLRGTSGRRTAALRHQTLRATLDWSYELLGGAEQVAFQRLAVFNGPFAMDSAAGLVAHGDIAVQEAVGAVMGLAEKSLIVTDAGGTMLRHRYLNTVRAYAFEKLRASEDFISIQRWHAEQVLKLMRQAELGWESLDRAEWIAAYGYAIDDVRAALDWAFSSEGDAMLGASLTSISVPFGLQLGRIEEFRARVEHALYSLRISPTPQLEIESRLRDTLSMLTSNLQRTQPAEAAAEAVRPDPVEGIGSPKDRISPLLRKAVFQIEGGDYEGAVKTAARMGAVAQKADDPLAVLTANRVAAQAHHFCGNHAEARAFAERVLDHPAKSIPVAYVPVQTDRRVWMRIVLARTAWIEAQLEEARRFTAEALELALADSPFALCQVLAFAACPISLWNGELEPAREHVRTLMAETRRYRLNNWKAYGEWYQAAIDAGLDPPLEGQRATRPSSELATASGLLLDTVLSINPWIAGVDPQDLGAIGWAAPERLRVQGEFLLREQTEDAARRAESLFLQALAHAEKQRALAWRLRAAISLGTLLAKQGRISHARTLMGDVLNRCSAGSESRDLKRARALLESFSSGG
jgi:predicted ATPase/DNA-binding winged helix-turn-helix (wHTH) protein